MPNFLLIMLGGAIGAASRYQLARLATERLGPAFPWGTLIVNLSGGFLMGLLAGLVVRDGPSAQPLLLFLGVGLLGGFTTFSGFSIEAVQMIQRGEMMLAGTYALASVIGSVMLLFVGLWVARVAA